MAWILRKKESDKNYLQHVHAATSIQKNHTASILRFLSSKLEIMLIFLGDYYLFL